MLRSYWLADKKKGICYWHVHTTDSYWHRIRYWHFYTTEQNVSGILIPWDDMLLTRPYHWHCITDSVLLTVYYWQCITDSMSIQLRDGLLRFLYHRAICDTRCITICWRYVVKGYFLSILITKSRWLTHFWVCISHQNQDQNLRLLLL